MAVLNYETLSEYLRIRPEEFPRELWRGTDHRSNSEPSTHSLQNWSKIWLNSSWAWITTSHGSVELWDFVWISSDTTWGVPAGAMESNWWLEQFWTDYSLTPKLVHNLAQQCLSMDNYIPWQCWMMGRCLIIFGYDLRSSRGSYGEELIIGALWHRVQTALQNSKSKKLPREKCIKKVCR